MIRIDEIYDNIFVPIASKKPNVGSHWFDPFGSTSIHDLRNLPPVYGQAEHRYLFYDQEVLHRSRLKEFLDSYTTTYDGPTTIVTSEYASKDVQWAMDTYGLNSAYYFFHGWAALDWYRGYNRTFLHQPKHIQHTFLCPNNIVGGNRQHRIELFNCLLERNLVDTNLISMPDRCPYEGIAVQDFLRKPARLPLKIDSFDGYANNSHCITMWEQAARTLLQVVTETCYSGNKLHLTEKTFKPMVLKQPFILVSNRGSLEYLRSYGFRTFEGIWDESYDSLPDNERTSAIADLLLELEHADWNKIQKQCEPVVQHNYDWFYSGKFEQVLWDELLGMTQSW